MAPWPPGYLARRTAQEPGSLRGDEMVRSPTLRCRSDRQVSCATIDGVRQLLWSRPTKTAPSVPAAAASPGQSPLGGRASEARQRPSAALWVSVMDSFPVSMVGYRLLMNFLTPTGDPTGGVSLWGANRVEGVRSRHQEPVPSVIRPALLGAAEYAHLQLRNAKRYGSPAYL